MGPSLYRRIANRKLALIAFGSMCSLYFFSYFHRVAVPGTLFNEMQSAFHASAGEVTALAAIYLYVYASMQLVVGVCADRFGATRTLLLGGVLLSVGSILFPLAPNLGTLYLTRALVGLGASSMYLCLVKQIDPMFGSRNFAPLMGVLLFVGYLGGFAGGVPLRWAVAAIGWRTSLLAVGVLCAATFLVAVVLLPRLDRSTRVASGFRLADVRRLFANRLVYPGFVCGPINFAIYLLFQATIGQKLLQDVCGYSPTQAATVTSTMILIVMVGSFVSGFLPALIGQRRKPIIVAETLAIGLACAGLLLGLSRKAPASWFIGCYLLLALATSVGGVATCILKEINPRRVTAFAVSLANGLTYLTVAALNSGLGVVMEKFRPQPDAGGGIVTYPPQAYQAICMGLLGLSLLAILAVTRLPETRGQQVPDDPPDAANTDPASA